METPDMSTNELRLDGVGGVSGPGPVPDAALGRADPEVPERARRRAFTAKYKLEIVAGRHEPRCRDRSRDAGNGSPDSASGTGTAASSRSRQEEAAEAVRDRLADELNASCDHRPHLPTRPVLTVITILQYFRRSESPDPPGRLRPSQISVTALPTYCR